MIDTPKKTDNDALLKEIRDDFTYFKDYWRENHEEAKTDLRYVSGDPWDPDERKAREDNKRPVVSPDELEQYLNQAINNLRQNPRAIKVNPEGEGATDKNASMRSAVIRGIEYKSNAQSAYTNAFESVINCGLGCWRLTTQYVRPGKSDEVEPRIKMIENALSSFPDPNCKEADFSDAKKWFLIDVMRKSDFTRKYPKAKKKSFTADDVATAPEWLTDQNIVVAEYWCIEGYDDEGQGGKVIQYITNGLEILEKREWIGSKIPIIMVTGKRVLIPKGSEMKRMFYSMVRKARGPQMMLAYIASQEAEEYGMAPRAPMIGYVGQFETDKEKWDNSNKVPTAYLQADPIVDQSSGAVLPLPTRNPFTPNAAAYEMGFERWRRSLQAAMGVTPLPTAAQRQNEKSGVALERIQTAQAIGSFHFTDNFNKALENCGRQLDELITLTMDTTRQVSARNPDESHSLMHIVPNGQQAPADAKPDEVLDPTAGEFGVTISTGPNYQSQREEASSFVDLLVQNLQNLPVAPPQKAALLAQAIKLKNVGPIGDEIAKIIDPQGDGDEQMPPQAQQAIAQLQQQSQQLNEACKQYEAKIQQLEFEKQAKIVDNQAKFEIEKLRLETNLAQAEINTKAQELSERLTVVHDLFGKLLDQAHEKEIAAGQQAHDATMQVSDQAHQTDMAQQAADNANQQQMTQIAADQQAAQQDGSSS